MKHVFNFEKYFESFYTKFNKYGWLKFGGTNNFNNTNFNSDEHFLQGRKSINPDKKIMDKVTSTVKNNFNLFEIEWNQEFRQLYCYFSKASKGIQVSMKERSESNLKILIIEFYDDNWIFVAIADGDNETHFLCDDIFGFENFIKSKKKYLNNK